MVAPVILVAGASCGDDAATEPKCKSPTCPIDYASIDLTTPSVSFETEVMPVFRRSCGLSSVCHGSATKSAAKLYLGPKLSDTTTVVDAGLFQKIIDGISGVASQTAPAIKLVEPSDPEHSFLMLKMDGCQNTAGLTCTPQPKSKSGAKCGDRMPQSGGVLCEEDRDLVRRWIAQGAQNN